METFDTFYGFCKRDFNKYIGDGTYINRILFFHIEKNIKYTCHSYNRLPVGITVFDGKEYYYFPKSEFYKYFYNQIELRKLKLQKIQNGRI